MACVQLPEFLNNFNSVQFVKFVGQAVWSTVSSVIVWRLEKVCMYVCMCVIIIMAIIITVTVITFMWHLQLLV